MMTKQGLALGLGLVAAFLAGGWVFTGFAPRVITVPQAEESAAALDTALPVITLQTDVTKPEDLPMPQEEAPEEGEGGYSQVGKIDLPNVTGIVPRVREPEEEEPNAYAPVIASDAKPVDTMEQTFTQIPAAEEEESKISLIVLPVKSRVIQNTQDYRAFKTQARGSYPQVDFKKQMVVVLESDSNFPDKVFEIDSAAVKDGKLEVRYRVNVFGLDQKINTHAVLAVDKTDAPVELKQVL